LATATTTTTTILPQEVVDVVLQSMATVEKVQNAVQECNTALGVDGEAAFCTLDAENCFYSCAPIKALYEKMSKRLDAVQAQDEGTGTAGLKASSLTPKKVPDWCTDEDTQCPAYGEDVCRTPGALSCAKYCGCNYKKVGDKYEAVTTAAPTTQARKKKKGGDDGDDLDDGEEGDGKGNDGDGTAQGSQGAAAASGEKKEDSSAVTIVIVVGVLVVVLIAVIAGAFIYVAKKKAPAGEPMAFSNPAYATGGEAFDTPTYAAAGNGNAGYMDVGPHGRQAGY